MLVMFVLFCIAGWILDSFIMVQNLREHIFFLVFLLLIHSLVLVQWLFLLNPLQKGRLFV